MTDVDRQLRSDAERWRVSQCVDSDLEVALRSAAGAVAASSLPRRRIRTVIAAVAAAAALAGGVLALQHVGRHRTAVSGHTQSTGPSDVPSTRATLPTLPAAPPGHRTLFRASGSTNQQGTLEAPPARGEIYAACIGGGTITVSMPGAGGFDLDCTGTPAGASIPTLADTVRITGVRSQAWSVAVYGP